MNPVEICITSLIDNADISKKSIRAALQEKCKYIFVILLAMNVKLENIRFLEFLIQYLYFREMVLSKFVLPPRIVFQDKCFKMFEKHKIILTKQLDKCGSMQQ